MKREWDFIVHKVGRNKSKGSGNGKHVENMAKMVEIKEGLKGKERGKRGG